MNKKGKYMYSLGRVFNTPLVVHQSKLDEISSFLLGGNTGEVMGAFSLDGEAIDGGSLLTIDGDIGVMRLEGTLVSRSTPGNSGMLSYQDIEHACDIAISSNLSTVVLKVHSPGGEVDNLARAKDAIDRMSDSMSVVAVVDRKACSAMYWLISGVSKIYLADEDARVGSIGVIWQHFDYSKALEDEGVEITTVYRGDRKNDFSPYSKLGKEPLAAINREIDDIYGKFVSACAAGRGMAEDAVIKTQAGVYSGYDAIKCGLADEIKDFKLLMGELMSAKKVLSGLMASDEGMAAIEEAGLVAKSVADANAEAGLVAKVAALESSFEAKQEEIAKTAVDGIVSNVKAAATIASVSGIQTDAACNLIVSVADGSVSSSELGAKIAELKSEESHEIDGSSPADDGASPAAAHLGKYKENKTV